MKARVIVILLFFLTYRSVSAQRALTKEEILHHYKASHKKERLAKDSIKLTWSDELNIKLRYRMISLRNSGIDSLIVYSVSYPGCTYRLDSCTSGYGTSAYLFWKRLGRVTIEKFNGECFSIISNAKPADVFAFYDSHYSQLKDEMFMPIIYSGETNGNEIIYKTSISFHEPTYSLYYGINSRYNFFTFGESELTDEKNMFYNYNLDLAAYQLWRLITVQVSKQGDFTFVHNMSFA